MKYIALVATALLSAGCQVGYLAKSAYSQADLLRKRIPIEDAVKSEKLTDEQKRKLLLAQEARLFAESHLKLSQTKNYGTFVQLEGPYVTYVVSAAPRSELKHYLWRYPLVGEMPYKGFFDKDDATREAASLKTEGLDTYIRGVSAYSTLGWFRDPVLSSMLDYKDYDLVNTIIHETVHATLFIKSEADFNERLATFIGNKGTEAFYRQKEGADSKTLAAMKAENVDEEQFGKFMSTELKALEAWYKERQGKEISEEERRARIGEIQARFKSELKPKLKDPESFKKFESADLNNARLLTYRLYFEDLHQFEKVFDKLGRDFSKFLSYAKSLEKSDNPVKDLETAAAAQ
ncbi:MAG TPA: aminopeptidase [Bdellovibrionales bacterium]|nr:aminopeptidase [Bdellovibrionales bacterium]